MSGYTPVFDTVFNGTLCGKWPDLPVWLSLLPLADWRGHIDMTPQAIARMTGWPMDLLVQGIQALTEPDPDSRSADEQGRRLMLLDPTRKWGWRVVNIQKYRRLASGQNHSANQVEDGRNAEKVRRYKERHQQTPSTPPDTSKHQNSYSDSYVKEEQPRKSSADTRRGSRIPIPFPMTEELRAWAKSETPDVDVTAVTAEFVDYWRAVPGQKGCKIDWIATWRNRMREKQGRAKQFGKPKQASEWM